MGERGARTAHLSRHQRGERWHALEPPGGKSDGCKLTPSIAGGSERAVHYILAAVENYAAERQHW